jgi:hypothetical protein
MIKERAGRFLTHEKEPIVTRGKQTKARFVVTCFRCTRTAGELRTTRDESIKDANGAGWFQERVYSARASTWVWHFYCPACLEKERYRPTA